MQRLSNTGLKIDAEKVAKGIGNILSEEDILCLRCGMIPKHVMDAIDEGLKYSLVNAYNRMHSIEVMTPEEVDTTLEIMPLREGLLEDASLKVTVALLKRYCLI